jgi:hypothetical protein
MGASNNVPVSFAAAAAPPPTLPSSSSFTTSNSNTPYPSDSDFTLVAAAAAGRENFMLRQQLLELQNTIRTLQNRVDQLESENSQLRQLPTGKISQIPLEYVCYMVVILFLILLKCLPHLYLIYRSLENLIFFAFVSNSEI